MDSQALLRLADQHARFPDQLRALVEPLDDAGWRARPTPERWSPLEIVAHLRDEETEDFGDRARCAAEGVAIERRIDPAGWVLTRGYNDLDPSQVLRSFSREREASCAWLRALDVNKLTRTPRHERLSDMRCGDFIAAWRLHDLLHLRQLTTTLSLLTAKELDGWQLGYAGDLSQL